MFFFLYGLQLPARLTIKFLLPFLKAIITAIVSPAAFIDC